MMPYSLKVFATICTYKCFGNNAMWIQKVWILKGGGELVGVFWTSGYYAFYLFFRNMHCKWFQKAFIFQRLSIKKNAWKNTWKKNRKMNKERKLKCKQVWGKQIKLNNIPWTNTCNNSFTINVIILYTVLRGSALFKGSMQNIVIWETWHKFWCSAIKLHRCFQNKQKLKNNINL